MRTTQNASRNFTELADIILLVVIIQGKISSNYILKYFLIFTLFISQNTFSQSPVKEDSESKKGEWHLRKNENGIQVYTRRPPGSDIDELKATSVIHASLSSIVAVIMDADHYCDWIYACEKSNILRQINSTVEYQYQVIDVPSPFSDRDVVIHFMLWQDPKTKTVYTHSIAAPDSMPVKNGLVRLQVFDSSYQLVPQANGDVQVIYTLRTDPGGYIPDWLVNMTIVIGPYQTTLKMNDQVKKPEYANSKLSFIQEP